ncbi:phosphonate ABC transporter, permease protein PhnE, partial [Pseudomonas putida]|nr:phosphonate ABC transporter, permease protein PhnE [Pseudomonas putida]
QEAQASTVIMGMLLLVLFVDLLSDVLRQRYVRA